ncbi:hypothetical protein [Sporomusa aerivorans]|uniref:hypothetical protein n=1 Tax=Sporomusa aerivorans TaxID=204936 RepID=UPI00352A87E7
MSISSVSSATSLYQSIYPANSSSQENQTSILSISSGDSVELSSAGINASASAGAVSGTASGSSAGSTGTSNCPQGNATCVNCGACEVLATDGLTGGSGTTSISGVSNIDSTDDQDDYTTDFYTSNAINAYESQSKYL